MEDLLTEKYQKMELAQTASIGMNLLSITRTRRKSAQRKKALLSFLSVMQKSRATDEYSAVRHLCLALTNRPWF